MAEHGLIFASDERLYYCGLFLRERGYEVQIIQTPEEWDPEKVRGEKPDFVFLPIRGTTDGTIKLAGGGLDLRAFLEGLPPETAVLAGLWSDYVRFLPCSFVCYQEDREFAAKNSLLTAEGILYLLLRKTPKSRWAYTYDVIGGGRVGTALVELLRKLGLTVRLVSHSGRDGAVSLESWQKAGDPADVVVNTATAPVITEACVRSWKKRVCVFDVSSGMRGTEPGAREYNGIAYCAAPPLPGLVAPESAGQLLAESFLRTKGEL